MTKDKERETEETQAEEENLTPSEEEDVKEEGISGEVAHREGEFEELNAKLNKVMELVTGFNTAMEELKAQSQKANDVAAEFVENGAVIQDVEENVPQPIVDTLDAYREEYPDMDEKLDLDM